MLGTDYWLQQAHHRAEHALVRLDADRNWVCYRYRDKWIAVSPTRRRLVLDLDGEVVTLWLGKQDLKLRIRRLLPQRFYFSMATLYRAMPAGYLLREFVAIVGPFVPRAMRAPVYWLYRRLAARRSERKKSPQKSPSWLFRLMIRISRKILRIWFDAIEACQSRISRYMKEEAERIVIEQDSLAMVRRMREVSRNMQSIARGSRVGLNTKA
jgi:hypothetical protein